MMEKMKIPFKSVLTEYLWDTLNKVTNTSSNLMLNKLVNGDIKMFLAD